MKKYIKPAVVEVKLENESLLNTVSGMLDGETPEQGARGFDLGWDEDDEK